MIGIGVGEMFGAIFLGRIQDKFGDTIALIVCLILTLIGCAAALSFTIFYSFKLWMAVIMTFCWGA